MLKIALVLIKELQFEDLVDFFSFLKVFDMIFHDFSIGFLPKN